MDFFMYYIARLKMAAFTLPRRIKAYLRELQDKQLLPETGCKDMLPN